MHHKYAIRRAREALKASAVRLGVDINGPLYRRIPLERFTKSELILMVGVEARKTANRLGVQRERDLMASFAEAKVKTT